MIGNKFLVLLLFTFSSVSANDNVEIYIDSIKSILNIPSTQSIELTDLKSFNAYANDGKIVIDYDLFLSLEHEAELFFIIAHEYAHITQKHSLNETYSKVHEQEADSLALTYHTNICQGGIYFLRTLSKKIRYENNKEIRNQLSSASFQIDSTLLCNLYNNPFSALQSSDNIDFGHHPSVNERLEFLEKKNNSFVPFSSNKRLKSIQNIVTNKIHSELYFNQNYVGSINHLIGLNNRNKVQETFLLNSLYKIFYYKLNKKLSVLFPNFDTSPNLKLARISCFFQKISDRELYDLVFYKLNDALKKYPNDLELIVLKIRLLNLVNDKQKLNSMIEDYKFILRSSEYKDYITSLESNIND